MKKFIKHIILFLVFTFIAGYISTNPALSNNLNEKKEPAGQTNTKPENSEVKELYLKTGHNWPVNKAVFTPDGKYVISAGSDKTIKLWDIKTGKVIRTCKGHKSSITDIVVFNHGIIASAGYDKTIKIWTIFNGQDYINLSPNEILESIVKSPDNSLLISGGWEGYVKIWRIRTGEQIQSFKAHDRTITDMDISPDGEALVTTSMDKIIKLWDFKTRKLIKTFQGHKNSVYCTAISKDKKTIAAAGYGGKIIVWDVESNEIIHTLEAGKKAVNSLEFSKDNLQLLSSGSDMTAKIWDLKSGKLKLTMNEHKGRVNCASFSSDGTMIITGSDDRSMILWNAGSGAKIKTFAGFYNSINFMSFSPAKQVLAVSSGKSSAQIWDIENGKLLHTLSGHKSYIPTVKFSPDGKKVSTASYDGAAKIWDAATGNLIKSIDDNKYRVHDTAFSYDGKFFAVADGNIIKVRETESSKIVWQNSEHRNIISNIEFNPKGSTLAALSADRTIGIYDIKKGKTIKLLYNRNGAARQLAYSNNGEILGVTIGTRIVLWDVKTWKRIFVSKKHGDFVNSIGFNVDDTLAASAGKDGIVRFWDLKEMLVLPQGKTTYDYLVTSLNIGFSFVNSIEYQFNGNLLAVDCQNGMIKIFDTSGNALMSVINILPNGQWLAHDADYLKVRCSVKAKDFMGIRFDNNTWKTGGLDSIIKSN